MNEPTAEGTSQTNSPDPLVKNGAAAPAEPASAAPSLPALAGVVSADSLAKDVPSVTSNEQPTVPLSQELAAAQGQELTAGQGQEFVAAQDYTTADGTGPTAAQECPSARMLNDQQRFLLVALLTVLLMPLLVFLLHRNGWIVWKSNSLAAAIGAWVLLVSGLTVWLVWLRRLLASCPLAQAQSQGIDPPEGTCGRCGLAFTSRPAPGLSVVVKMRSVQDLRAWASQVRESHAERLSQQLDALLVRAAGQPMTVGGISDSFGPRGFELIIMMLAFPFIIPVPLPGVSVPFGAAIAIIGLQIARGQKPWLPEFVAKREMSYGVLERIILTAKALFRRFERIMAPRYDVFLSPLGRRIAGVALCSSGVGLALPLPPFMLFTNAVPAISILLIAGGLLESDGLFVLLGKIFAVLSWVWLVIQILFGVIIYNYIAGCTGCLPPLAM